MQINTTEVHIPLTNRNMVNSQYSQSLHTSDSIPQPVGESQWTDGRLTSKKYGGFITSELVGFHQPVSAHRRPVHVTSEHVDLEWLIHVSC